MNTTHIKKIRSTLTRIETAVNKDQKPNTQIASMRRQLDELELHLSYENTPQHIRLLDMPHVYHALRELPYLEAAVLMYRSGVLGHKPKTLDELSNAFGVTRERIRQIESRAAVHIDQIIGEEPHPWKFQASRSRDVARACEEYREQRNSQAVSGLS